MKVLEIRNKIIRPILLPIGFTAVGFAVALLTKKFVYPELNRLEISIIAFIATTVSVLYFFPKVFKIPFGKISIKGWISKVGLYKPDNTYKYILLGSLLGIITLSGMLFSSFQIGGYKPDLSKITLGQAVFSLTPGIWEEILFRGVLMIVLIRITKSLKKAAIIQVVLFGLAHIKGLDLLSFADAFSVMILAISFTYVTYKTKSLIPAIIFHYLHDAFLFFVQLPDDKYIGFTDNAIFYSNLFLSIILAILITKKMVEHFNIQGNYDFYSMEGIREGNSINKSKTSEKEQRKNKANKIILILNAALFSTILLTNYNETDLIIVLFYLLFIGINIFLFVTYQKYRKSINLYINIINAIIAFVTSYDLYEHGSQTVYYIWIIIGFANLIVSFFVYKKEKKSLIVKGND